MLERNGGSAAEPSARAFANCFGSKRNPSRSITSDLLSTLSRPLPALSPSLYLSVDLTLCRDYHPRPPSFECDRQEVIPALLQRAGRPQPHAGLDKRAERIPRWQAYGFEGANNALGYFPRPRRQSDRFQAQTQAVYATLLCQSYAHRARRHLRPCRTWSQRMALNIAWTSLRPEMRQRRRQTIGPSRHHQPMLPAQDIRTGDQTA